MRILYGPVASWRFGRSLGVDPIALRHKQCPFSCVYCQYGATEQPTVHRRSFVPVDRLEKELDTLGKVAADCVTFAGLGEPTLAANLPSLVDAVRKRVARPVVVLTGGALLPDARVRHDLSCFDRVVVTLNATDEALFRQINRPTPGYPYSLQAIQRAVQRFRDSYTGALVVQVMLVQANVHAAQQMANWVRSIAPDEIQLSTPLQPALGGPISAQEMQVASLAFAGLPVRCLYERGQAQVSPRIP